MCLHCIEATKAVRCASPLCSEEETCTGLEQLKCGGKKTFTKYIEDFTSPLK